VSKSNVESVTFGDTLSPSQILVNAQQEGDDHYKHLIIVGMDQNGFIDTSWSNGFTTTHLGMLTWAAHRMMARQNEQNEERADDAS